MSKLIEIAAMVLGGLSLFAVSFVAFTMVSGTDMRRVAVIGSLLPEVAVDGDGEPVAEPETHALPPMPQRTNEQVVEASLGVLGTWNLPSPYTQNELQALADELKMRRSRLELRANDLDVREQDLEAEQELIAEQHRTLEAMKAELEAFQAELALREQELRNEERAVADAHTERWKGVARVIAGLETDAAATRLKAFEPVEAARILTQMDDERAATLLNELDGKLWKDYVDAYTDLLAERGARPRD